MNFSSHKAALFIRNLVVLWLISYRSCHINDVQTEHFVLVLSLNFLVRIKKSLSSDNICHRNNTPIRECFFNKLHVKRTGTLLSYNVFNRVPLQMCSKTSWQKDRFNTAQPTTLKCYSSSKESAVQNHAYYFFSSCWEFYAFRNWNVNLETTINGFTCMRPLGQGLNEHNQKSDTRV